MKFSFGILVLASAVVSGFAASIPIIKADVSSISSHVVALEQSVNALPSKGATLNEAIAIQSNAGSLGVAFDKAAKDIKSTSHFSEGDGKAIFDEYRGSASKLVQISSNLIKKKAAIKALPLPGVLGIVQAALKSLHSSLDAFENAMIASEPNDVKGQVKNVKGAVDDAFAKAVAAYAN